MSEIRYVFNAQSGSDLLRWLNKCDLLGVPIWSEIRIRYNKDGSFSVYVDGILFKGDWKKSDFFTD